MALTILLAFATSCLVIAALYQFWLDVRAQANLALAVNPRAMEDLTLARRSRIDRIILRTRIGPWTQEAITLLGWNVKPRHLLLIIAALCGAIVVALGVTLSWLLAPVGVVVGALLVRGRVRKLREKHTEDFIAQMPELARTLSNAASAGLSIRTAVALAADELAEPAHSELKTVSDEIQLGVSLDTALSNLEGRLPSRELGILVSSLVVGARSGGGLVTALRDIAETLDTRKEVRREIKTLYTQTIATAYAVLGVSGLAVFLLEGINPGTVDKMITSLLGQGAIIFAVVVYSGCIWAVRKMTRVDL